MLPSPYLAGVVSLAVIVWYMYLLEFDCRRYTEQNKTYVFRCKYSKRAKTKEKEVTFSKKLRRRICAITSFEEFARNQPVCRSVIIYFVLSNKVYYFLWLAKLWTTTTTTKNPGWTPQHGGQWRHFATTLARCGACSISSALWMCCVANHSIKQPTLKIESILITPDGKPYAQHTRVGSFLPEKSLINFFHRKPKG